MSLGLLREPVEWCEAAVLHMPGEIGYRARRWWARRRFGALGAGARLGPGLLVTGAHRIRVGAAFSCWRHCTLAACGDGDLRIGDHVSANANVYINACSGGQITIGDHVLIGPNVVLRASDHVTTDGSRPIRLQGHVPGRITIGDDVWLSANVTVVGGVTIGRGAVVGANAVVTRDVPPFTIVGGVPAKPIGMRGESA